MTNPEKPEQPSFDPNDAQPGAKSNNPYEPDDPRNPKSSHPVEPTEQHNRIIKQPRKE